MTRGLHRVSSSHERATTRWSASRSSTMRLMLASSRSMASSRFAWRVQSHSDHWTSCSAPDAAEKITVSPSRRTVLFFFFLEVIGEPHSQEEEDDGEPEYPVEDVGPP